MERTSRAVWSMADNIIHQAIPDLDASVKKVIIYYIDITNKEEINKFIKNDGSTTVEIKLWDLKSVLYDMIIDDHAELYMEEGHDELYGSYAAFVDKFLSDRVMQKTLTSPKGSGECCREETFQAY